MANTITATPVTGGAASGTGVASQVQAIYTLGTVFSGQVEETVAGNVDRMQKAFTLPGTEGALSLKLKAVSSTLGASAGNTVVWLSLGNYADSGADKISLTLAGDAASSALTEDILAANAGDAIYLYIGADPAEHTDLEIQVSVEGAPTGVSAVSHTLTAGVVLSLVRRYLNDTNASAYFWADSVLYGWMSVAHRRLLSLLPDVALASDGSMPEPVDPDSSADVLVPSKRWREWLAHYTAAMALEESMDDPPNAAAATRHYEACARMGGV